MLRGSLTPETPAEPEDEEPAEEEPEEEEPAEEEPETRQDSDSDIAEVSQILNTATTLIITLTAQLSRPQTPRTPQTPQNIPGGLPATLGPSTQLAYPTPFTPVKLRIPTVPQLPPRPPPSTVVIQSSITAPPPL